MAGSDVDAGYSPRAYEDLVRRFRDAGYAFLSYQEPPGESRSLYLRHDIDYSLSWAVELASCNVRCGVRGTFFLQLRSPLYNLLAFETLAAVRQLVDAGQWIGFHVTLPETDLGRDERAELIRRDFDAARAAIPELQPVFAWHNPSLRMNDEDLNEEVAGFVNAYGSLAGTPVTYVGDSNLRYTAAELADIARAGTSPLQLALAPMQWMPDRRDMPAILARNLGRKLRDLEVEFVRNHVYRERLPEGLPEPVVDAFEHAVESAWRGAPGPRKPR